ncbi:MAG: substrate-binding domain-containing protein [Bacteroidetes bacterium]|nr:substrate-binding domain-containing protein [Bacteroidota bacterium]
MEKKIVPPNVLFLLLVLIWGCNNNSGQLEETPTRGNIKIGADESFQLLVDTEISTFESLYKYAHIKPLYKPEAEVIADLLNDSVRMVVVTRTLTQQENDYLMTKQVIARSTKIAHDGVAFILNGNNPDTNLRYDQVQGIIQGTITNWKQINPKSSLGEIVTVFDNTKSGNFRFLQELFLKGKTVPKTLFAVKNNPEVLQYVQTKANAIGVIGVNWISDKNDTLSQKFLKGVKVAAIGRPGDTQGSGDFFKPYQAYIADVSYPFIRDVFAIKRESFTGLGSGFYNFLAGDVGQRIILKSRLVPATMPVRLVQIKNHFD